MTKKNLPKYLQIEVDLIDKINSGVYAPGDALPTEEELAKYYDVSRVTIRNSLANLVQKSYVTKQQGAGTFVSKNPRQIKTPTLKSFTEEMTELKKEVETEVVSFSIVKAETQVSRFLQINKNDKVYYIERLRKANNLPMMFERTFMSVEAHKDLSISVLKSSKIHYADEKKFDLSHSEQIVEPFLATKYIADFLNVNVSDPILRVKNTTYNKDGSVFDYTEMFLHPDNYRFSIIKQR